MKTMSINLFYPLIKSKSFFNKSQVLETECVPINNIEIKKEFDICTKHLQVKFVFNSTLIDGFLTKDLILRSDSYFKKEIYLVITNITYKNS